MPPGSEGLARTARCVRVVPSWSRAGLWCVQEVLREQGVVTATRAALVLSPTQVLIARFQRYLCSERGLFAGTVRGYVRHADRFVAGLGPAGVELGDATAAVLTAAVLREAVGVSVSAAQNFVAGLRAFLHLDEPRLVHADSGVWQRELGEDPEQRGCRDG